MSMVIGDALSLLLFRLHSGRLLGINLLKVNEIIPCPALTKLLIVTPMFAASPPYAVPR